jgi:isopentenyl phosphate kinase
MGRIENLVIVKLGGSLITNKDLPESPNIHNMKLVCREISQAISTDKNLHLFLIHGGGSFGHFFAKTFGLGTVLEKNVSPEGLARTASAMIKLHSIMLEELNSAGVFCGTILPLELLSKNGESVTAIGESRISSMLGNGLVPITFGNVSVLESGSYIISGDKIALVLARKFRVTKAIFAMDVDGVYRSAEMTGSIIRELEVEPQIKSRIRDFDVTGGLQSKITTGLELSKLGTDVFFVNGSKKTRLSRVLLGDNNALATKIYSQNN